MKLVSYPEGFGRIEADALVPMGSDIVAYLGGAGSIEGEPVALDSVHIGPPIPRPDKILCIGLNYRDHAAETGGRIPERPILFPKFSNSVIGPGQAIEIPEATGEVDYEAELGVVIGKRATQVTEAEALEYVAGYMCLNDVSARDLQFSGGGQWMWGKAIDTFLPAGPWLVTTDEVPDPQRLGIRCLVNGSAMQDSNTSEMVFSVAELVSFMSATITMEPGDLIATGTPAGVGFARKPPVFLASGDEVTVEIEGLGALTNPVRARRRANA